MSFRRFGALSLHSKSSPSRGSDRKRDSGLSRESVAPVFVLRRVDRAGNSSSVLRRSMIASGAIVICLRGVSWYLFEY